MKGRCFGAGLALGFAALGYTAAPVSAQGYQPYYGFSSYYGGPAVYYTAHPDVQQATTMRDGYQGLGVTTYTTGGPFWRYKPVGGRPLPRRHDHDVVRVKG